MQSVNFKKSKETKGLSPLAVRDVMAICLRRSIFSERKLYFYSPIVFFYSIIFL